MANKIVLAGASVQGRDHSVVGKNNQDSFVIGQKDDAYWGIVCDGCGEGSRSEVGAHLVTALAHRLFLNVANYSGMTTHTCVSNLMSHIVDFQQDMLRWFTNEVSVSETRSQFAFDHMLCTVVGFFGRGDFGYLFWAGDGSYQVGSEKPVEIQADNRPRYLAYNALQQNTPIFQSVPFDLSEYRRISISTDGFDSNLFDACRDKATSNSLKRFLNVQKHQGKFHDDATVVTAQLVEEGH